MTDHPRCAQFPFEVVDLGHELFAGMPVHESHPQYLFTPYYRHGDFVMPDEYWGSNELFIMSGHTGTHVDALSHISARGRFFDGAPSRTAYDGIHGITHLGAETITPYVGRGVFLDLAAAHSVDVLPREYAIGADEVDSLLSEAEITLRPGDAVLVRTGFGQLWERPTEFLADPEGNPGVDLSAARLFSAAGVWGVGADTSIIEHYPVGSDTLPVHRHLIAESGIHIIENLNLEPMPRERAMEFWFVCAPLKVRGSSGGPVRPLAFLHRP